MYKPSPIANFMIFFHRKAASFLAVKRHQRLACFTVFNRFQSKEKTLARAHRQLLGCFFASAVNIFASVSPRLAACAIMLSRSYTLMAATAEAQAKGVRRMSDRPEKNGFLTIG